MLAKKTSKTVVKRILILLWAFSAKQTCSIAIHGEAIALL